jgi:hypothetical protein
MRYALLLASFTAAFVLCSSVPLDKFPRRLIQSNASEAPANAQYAAPFPHCFIVTFAPHPSPTALL